MPEEGLLAQFKRFVVGKPIPSHLAHHERLSRVTGLAVLGWPRQRAIDFLVDNAGLDPAFAASEVDRYCAWPGQATSYMLGQLEIRRLRTEAERALGSRFDVRAFHDAVLENGAVPLDVLRQRIDGFVRELR